MKRNVSLVVITCLLSSWAAAAISLTVNSQPVDTLPLKIGQVPLIEIRSDDNSPYTAYVGFDDGTAPLGILSHSVAFSSAGNLASISPVAAPPLYGYYVNAAGTSPAPTAGLHFRFAYGADAIGQTILKLYDSTLSTVLDSIVITVESAETGTGFTYQGRLLDGNQSAEGLYDFVFTLFTAPSEGTVIGAIVTLEDIEVMDGYFTALLDFGDVFGSKAQWLQTSVRPGDLTGDYTVLTPRQRLTPTPHAAYAARSDWDNLDNMPAGFADGIDNAGLSTETDPTVPASIKDGLSWSEITSIPAGFADGADNDTTLSETQVEGFIANDITTGYVPYDNGTKLVSSPLIANAQDAAIGTAVNSDRKLNLRTDSDTFGFFSENAKTSGSNYAIRGDATGDTTSSSYGLFGKSFSALGTNYGVVGMADTASSGTNYGVYGSAANSGTGAAYAGYFSGDVRATGNLNKDYDLQIATEAGAEVAIGTSIDSNRKVNIHTDSDSYGLFCENANPSGGRYGVFGAATGHATGSSYGVYGQSTSDYGGNFGVFGTATNASSGTNIGVYGVAYNSGTGQAYAGYFDGNVYVSYTLSAANLVDRTPYPKDLATAYDAVLSMERLPDGQYQEDDKEQQLDHSKLSPFIQSEEGHRDLSATVSCLNEVVKDLVNKVELQQQLIELQNQQIQQLTEQLQSVQD